LKANQQKHDAGVASWARQITAAGWSNVWSDLPGNVKPPLINGHLPDVYATHNGYEYVVEIETSDSLNSSHALLQKTAFMRWAALAPTRRKFEIRIA